MIHHVMMGLAELIRLVRRWTFRLALIIGLIALNIATVVSGTVYDGLSRFVWGLIEVVSENFDTQRPKTRAELQAEADRARTQADTAEAEARKAKADLDSTRAHAIQTQARMDAEIVQARTEAVTARTDAQRTQAELDSVAERNRVLSVDLDAREARIAKLTTDLRSYRQATDQAVGTVGALKSRIVSSIRRGASSDALGAVPFIGTGVALGLIAYELNDSCQQLRELEALDAALRGKAVDAVSESTCLVSFEDMVAALTGQDRNYAQCVLDRISQKDLNPASCAGYEAALPAIEDSTLGAPEDIPQLPRID